MTKRKPKKTQKRKNGAVRERDLIPWKYCLLTLVCGSFLVVGFFGAARQHFASIDYGIKNSKLRKQIKDLEAEQNRLILAREVALSPFEIKKAARKIGLFDKSPDQTDQTISAVKVSDKKTDSNQAEKTADKSGKEASDKKTKKEEESNSKKKSGDKKVPEKTASNDKKKSTGKNATEKKSNKLKKDKPKNNEKSIKRSRKVNTEK